MQPFLCIITPIFDPSLVCVTLLIKGLKQQSFRDFIHVCISNGLSPHIKNLIESLKDPRFIYDEIPFEYLIYSDQLIANLGKRREFCLKKYDADRYTFFDVDLKLLKNDYFRQLKAKHDASQVDVILASTKNGTSVYPRQEHSLGQIDIANYTFSQKIAKQYHYPTDVDSHYGWANDYRFYEQFKHLPTQSLDIIFAEKDGNNKNRYRRVSDYHIGEKLE